ncbi:MAG: hypothetical protein NTV05_12500 [Acidobacteria bacterium]|nr:hypothetical protein [Acidobacteriota bacterium]
MSVLDDSKMYARFAWGLRGFLRHTLTVEEALATVRRRLAEREQNFLRLVRKGIFGYARSPYRQLLEAASCQMGDIERLVRSDGLEGTLRALRDAGVFVTFEEFKGRTPIVRNGRVINAGAHDFRNPYLSAAYAAETSGSTGAGARVDIDLDNLAAQASQVLLAQHAHGVAHVPMAIWRAPLPDGSGIANILRAARFGNVPEKWFSPIGDQDLRPPLRFRIATKGIVALARLYGRPIPSPERVTMNQAVVVARWAIATRQACGACVVRAHVSMALRVCLAARAEGLDLSGVTFVSGGEPPTPAKVNAITSTGAGWLPVYISSDVGCIGAGCARPVDGNDLHLFKDGVAVIVSERHVPGWDAPLGAFCFTSLLPAAPMLLLNVESDDVGVIETRNCGCPLEAYGLTDHLREVRSFSKLTGEGVTLVGSDMVRILEEVLPARFGGSPLDYQLLEEEDDVGHTRLYLVISPTIQIDDEAVVVDTVLASLRQDSVATADAAAIWSQAGTLRVRRAVPAWTARGKFMPLRGPRR